MSGPETASPTSHPDPKAIRAIVLGAVCALACLLVRLTA